MNVNRERVGAQGDGKEGRRRRSTLLDGIYRCRARWSARRIAPWLAGGDRVLDIGAGDCHLDVLLATEPRCTVTPVDVTDGNRTDLALTLYDGHSLPYADDTFDVGLLLFVLHHAEDPGALLREVRRVCRRRVLAIEDVILTRWDKGAFRAAHWLYDRFLGLSYPTCEWPPERWAALAGEAGLVARWSGPIGRQFGYVSTRQIMYVWDRA